MKGASEKGDVSADRLAAGKAGDRLDDDCLENRRGQILSCRAFIDQRLDVRLCENAAARRNRVKRMILLGVLVESLRVRLQKGGHLVDKRTGAAGTGSVHTLLYIAVFKIDYLGVLTAKFNCNVCFRRQCLDCLRFSYDLLHKRDAQMISERKPPGARDDRIEQYVAQPVMSVRKELLQSLPDFRVMSFIIAEEKIPVSVKYCYFYRGRTHVYSESVKFHKLNFTSWPAFFQQSVMGQKDESV